MAVRQGTLALLARLGYGARGLVYLIVGGLAATAAFGAGGGTTGPKGALRTLLDQPFGQGLLGITALGLLGFALWRFLQAVADADHHGRGAKGMAIRAGWMISGCLYIGLAVFALSLIFGWGAGGGGDEQGAQGWTAWLMARPFGRWLVGLAGGAVVAAGVAMAIKGWQATFARQLAMSAAVRRWAVPLGRFGLIARGVVFVIIGLFLAMAALQADPSEARGLAGALAALQQQPYGPLLFAVIALGLVAFGVFGFVQAAYRRIVAPEPEAALRDAKRAVLR